jgi:alkaline phosphatase D
MQHYKLLVIPFVILIASLFLLAHADQSRAIGQPNPINSILALYTIPPAQAPQPAITHGPISGEVSDTSVVLWARGNVTGTLEFEVADNAEFSGDLLTGSAGVAADGDFTGETLVEGLTPGQTYFYRVSLAADSVTSDPVEGQFTTAPAADAPAAFDFVFGACLGGQGYCRDPETGWAIFNTMLAEEPDFFLITGDSIYASSACPTPNNLPGAETPAQTLTDFRARYRYHLEDENYANFLAQVPVYVSWDDHEVKDDYSGLALASQNPQRLQDGRQSFFEYWPVRPTENVTDTYRLYRQISYGAQADFFILDARSYRDPNVNWDPHPRNFTPKTMLGAEQFAWLQQALAESQATWKFIVTSVPLAYPTGFPQPEVDGRDSWANFTEKSGFETELLALLFYIESQDINNVVFLTGDTHWPFAISYDPDRNGEANFYEFGSSPLSAIPLAPAPSPDPTLNPTVLYAEGEFQGTLFNFGQVSVADDGALTFRIVDREGAERYSQTLTPQ